MAPKMALVQFKSISKNIKFTIPQMGHTPRQSYTTGQLHMKQMEVHFLRISQHLAQIYIFLQMTAKAVALNFGQSTIKEKILPKFLTYKSTKA